MGNLLDYNQGKMGSSHQHGFNTLLRSGLPNWGAMLFWIIPAAHAGELPVTLFGQPCQLKGAFSSAQLKAIHAISPEKTPPEFDEESVRATLERLKNSGPPPAALDRFRGQIIRHFESWAAYYRGVVEAKKQGRSEPLLLAVKDYLRPRAAEAFLSRPEFASSPARWNSVTIDRLKQAYAEAVGPKPEEEFHTVIQKLNVRYDCSFDESAEDSGEETSEETPAVPLQAPSGRPRADSKK